MIAAALLGATALDGSDKAIEAIYALLDGKPYLSEKVAAKMAAKTEGHAPPSVGLGAA